MSTTTRQHLHQLVDMLPEQAMDRAARLLEALSGLESAAPLTRGDGDEAVSPSIAREPLMTPAEVRQQFGPAALMPGTPPITSMADLAGDFWPEEESAEEFEATIRRWRDADRHA